MVLGGVHRRAPASFAALLLASLVALLAPAPLCAQGDEASPRRIHVVEQSSLLVRRIDTSGGLVVERADALDDGARRYLARHPRQFEVVTTRAFRRVVTGDPLYQGTLSVAEQWKEMGVRQYRELDIEGAISNLEKAWENYRAIHHQFVDPGEASELLMYLALSHLEREQRLDRALLYMKEMIRLDPSRVLRRGFYPDTTVEFYRSARNALIRELQGQEPSAERARRIAELVDADYLVFTRALPLGEPEGDEATASYRVVLFLWDVAEQRFAERIEVRLSSPAGRRPREERLAAAGNRLASRVADCLRRPARQRPTAIDSDGDSPLSIHLGLGYGAYQSFSYIQRPFGHLGLTVGARLALTEEFEATAAFQLLNAQRDRNGELIDDFNTFRGLLGGALGLPLDPFRLSLRVAAEVAHLTTFIYSTRSVCNNKPLPRGGGLPDGCTPADVQEVDAYDLLVGINAAPRVSVEVFRSFGFFAEASLSYYFTQPRRGEEVNFLLTGMTGVQYRF
jgi:tetratricopeptide (TPR) repeat protein